MLAAMTAVFVTLIAVNAAYATSLASLQLKPSSGEPGATIHVTGTWFATEGDRFSRISPVEIRWGGTDGPVLAAVRPDIDGTVITDITVPATASEGPHVVVATQMVVSRDRVAYAAPGTPARTVFTVGNPARPTADAHPARTPTGPRPDLAVPMAMITAGFGVFAVALRLFARDLRRTRI